MKIAAIPTKYRGTQFRSRLEARWAAFFDLLGWKWEYEPVDLNGYIPDFIVRRTQMKTDGDGRDAPEVPCFADPFLVEVKPFVNWPCAVLGCMCCPPSHGRNSIDPADRAEMDSAIRKIQLSGWERHAVIVGAAFPSSRQGVPRFGVAVDVDGEGSWFETETIITQCRRCPAYLAQPDIEGCGVGHCGERLTIPTDPTSLWREAGNRVQYKGAKATPNPRRARRVNPAWISVPTTAESSEPKVSAGELAEFDRRLSEDA